MNQKIENNSSGIGFIGLLTVLFVALKLTGFIGWSWWWVLSPLWITPILVIAGIMLFVMFMSKK
jgi:hypothetical protein